MNKIKEIREFLNAEKMKGDVFTNKLAVIGNGKELDGVKTIARYKDTTGIIKGSLGAVVVLGCGYALYQSGKAIYNKFKTRKISKNIENTDMSSEIISDEASTKDDDIVEDTIIISNALS